MRIGITGPRGRLGYTLVEKGCVPINCDISDRDAVIATLNDLGAIDVIINCAAYTQTDKAESIEEKDAVYGANLRGVGILRQEFDGYFVHISTGFVFNGAGGHYVEDDICAPINEYGWSKYGGERVALAMGRPTCIVRVMDLFGPGKKMDFVKGIRKILANPDIPTYEMPDNLFAQPTYVPSFADELLSLVINKSRTGILHLAGTRISKFDFAQMIAEKFGYKKERFIPTQEIKGAAPRPLDATLDTSLAKSLGLEVVSAEKGLDMLIELERAHDKIPQV